MRRRLVIQSRIPFRSWMSACVLLPLCWLGSNPHVVYSGDLDLWVPEDSSTVTTRGSFRWRIDRTRGLVFPRFSPRTSPRLKRGPPDSWHDAIGIDNRHVLHNRHGRTQQQGLDQEDSDDLPPLAIRQFACPCGSCNSPSADCKLPTASPTSASTASPVTDPQSYSPPCISWVSPPCSLRCHPDKHAAAPIQSPIQSPIETPRVQIESPRVLRSSKRKLILPPLTRKTSRIRTSRNLLWGNRAQHNRTAQHNSTTEQLPT